MYIWGLWSNIHETSVSENTYLYSYWHQTLQVSSITAILVSRHGIIKASWVGCIWKWSHVSLDEFSLRETHPRVLSDDMGHGFTCSVISVEKYLTALWNMNPTSNLELFFCSCSHNGCTLSFLSPGLLKHHLKVHEGYTCKHDGCEEKFEKWTRLQQHISAAHPKIKGNNDSVQPIVVCINFVIIVHT